MNSLEYVFSHLERHGVPFQKTIHIQTDWGAQYGSFETKSVKRYDQDLNQLRLKRTPPFTHLHMRKGRSEGNGFVGRSRRTDDEEFYRLEKQGFRNLQDFVLKASGWIYYHNYDHSHDGLGGKSLAQALQEVNPELPKGILFLPPIIIDDRMTLLRSGTEIYRYYHSANHLAEAERSSSSHFGIMILNTNPFLLVRIACPRLRDITS